MQAMETVLLILKVEAICRIVGRTMIKSQILLQIKFALNVCNALGGNVLVIDLLGLLVGGVVKHTRLGLRIITIVM